MDRPTIKEQVIRAFAQMEVGDSFRIGAAKQTWVYLLARETGYRVKAKRLPPTDVVYGLSIDIRVTLLGFLPNRVVLAPALDWKWDPLPRYIRPLVIEKPGEHLVGSDPTV